MWAIIYFEQADILTFDVRRTFSVNVSLLREMFVDPNKCARFTSLFDNDTIM